MENRVVKCSRFWPRLISRTGRYMLLAMQSTRMVKDLDYDHWNDCWFRIAGTRKDMFHRRITPQIAIANYSDVIRSNLPLIKSLYEGRPYGPEAEQLFNDFIHLQNSDA